MNQTELYQFHQGDAGLLRHVVERESPRLLAYATRLCGSADEAEDLVQETWLKAYRQRQTYRGAAPLSSWLISICRSTFLSRVRTANRRAEILAGAAASAAEHAAPPAAEARLLRRRLAGAIGDLPDRQRDVVVLRLVEGLSTRQCARRLRIAEGTVKSALHRALRTLRPMLEDLKP